MKADIDTTKVCRTCGIEKSTDDFYKRSDSGRLRGSCKACWSVRSIAHQRENPERYRQYRQTAYDKRKRYLRHVEFTYGLTPDQLDVMIIAQRGRCASCNDQALLAIDHDHATGKLRELLCVPCNRMLGQAKDEPWRLRAAAEYLERHQ